MEAKHNMGHLHNHNRNNAFMYNLNKGVMCNHNNSNKGVLHKHHAEAMCNNGVLYNNNGFLFMLHLLLHVEAKSLLLMLHEAKVCIAIT
jgi:hypothetical protein